MTSPPPLPLDLLRPILSHISDNGTLLSACLISKTFLHDARQRLWGDIALRSAAVTSFCITVSTSPTLGRPLRRLSLQLANDLPTSELDAVARALHLLPNLHALEITPPRPRPWADFVSYPSPRWQHDTASHILHGCPFRLTLFRSAFTFAHADFLNFLGEHNEIEELVSFDMARDAARLEGGMLPRLRRFWSPLQRLEFEEVESDGDGDVADGVNRLGKRLFYQGRMDIVLSARGLEDV
ncbi:hypothetical protein DFH06DRAFT_1471391 [Mycena polygramma]|nr:hypothetical protein DFH06DRAFT_1471391 [Mycena polygramma]